MNIYFDNAVFNIQNAGGVSVYWYQLVSRFLNSGAEVTFLNGRSDSTNIFEQKIDYSKVANIKESKISLRILRYLPVRFKIPAKSVFHAGYLRISTNKNIINIITIHDFAHEKKLSTRFPRGYANIFQKAYGIKNADGIICISENTKKDLLRFYPNTNVDKLKVIYHGIGNEFMPVKKNFISVPGLAIDLKEKYILYVGERRLYKNFNIAIDVIKRLSQYKLVIAGGSKLTATELRVLNSLIPNQYLIINNITPAELNILYNYAFCLIYPSIYEGFGLPLLEAMKAGCPVITTKKASIPEVVGNAGLMVDDINVPSFIEKIQMLEYEDQRSKYIKLGIIQAAKFTWDKCFEETLKFYKECWNKKFLN